MQLDCKRDLYREVLSKRCIALVRGPSVDVTCLLTAYLFGGCDLCGFNVDLCRFWMRSARQCLGQDTHLERVALFLCNLACLRPDMAMEAESIQENKFYHVIFPFGRRRARYMWIATEALPTLIRQGLYRILTAGELETHGEVSWAGILWYESYSTGNRLMADVLDNVLRLPLLAAAMRAFYLETEEYIKFRCPNDHPTALIRKAAKTSAAKALGAAVKMVLSRPEIWNEVVSGPKNTATLKDAFEYMRDHGFSERALRVLGDKAKETLAEKFPSSSSAHLQFLQQ